VLRQRGLLGLRRLGEGGVAGVDGREQGLRTRSPKVSATWLTA
jgi:hypothetical protein